MLEGVNRNRLLLLGAAAAVAPVVVVVVVVVASSGGGSGTTTAAGVDTTPDEASPAAVFAGVRQSGDTLGKASAPTLLVFEDPQCPFCREFNLNVLPTVVTDFVRTG